MRAVLLALAVPALLAACGKSSPTDAFFPLQGGRSWSYRSTTVFADDTAPGLRENLRLVAGGSTKIDGAQASIRRSNSGVEYWLRSDATGVYRVASQGPLDSEPILDATPRYVLRNPLVVGTQWQADTTTYVLQRRNEFPRELRHLPRYKKLPMNYRIEALNQEINTPAGSFKDCVRVVGIAEIKLYVDEAFAWRDVPLTTREWYCPDVGLAKLEREEPSPTKFILGGKLSMELVEWR